MKLGVVGLPNVGKSTLFNAITEAGAESANYPFCTIEPNVGVVAVPDARLDELGKLYDTKKIIPASVEFVDIAGLVKGASKGEGLGNKFLSHIREVDAIVHVVRCFSKEGIIHVEGSIDPLRDIETINLELIFADLETVAKRQAKVLHLVKGGDKNQANALDLLSRCTECLEAGRMLSSMPTTADEKEMLDSFFMLTDKPTIYCANIGEDDLGSVSAMAELVKGYAASNGAEFIEICAGVEEEIVSLPAEERAEYMEALGLSESGLDKMIGKCYELLGQISYLTAGEKECRAWTITRGMKAPAAAGKIHTDFEKGFIRAEVVAYDDLISLGSYIAAREAGKVRSEGKEYVVKDGDIVVFRFNV